MRTKKWPSFRLTDAQIIRVLEISGFTAAFVGPVGVHTVAVPSTKSALLHLCLSTLINIFAEIAVSAETGPAFADVLCREVDAVCVAVAIRIHGTEISVWKNKK